MATKRDLVEAHQFSRRRLITAFVSGAPGGREVEPARPGRALVGGLALALLVVAGGAVTGLIFGRDEADWKQPGLVISKERGQPYLVSTPEDGGLVIRPVVNVTSARLILGSESEPTYVSEDAITTERIGEPIGILNAPANVPEPQALVQSGWTACTSAESGLQLTLAPRPGVSAAPGAGFLVESRGVRYVIAQAASGRGEQPSAYSYELPADAGTQDNLLRDLGLSVGADASKVTTDWLSLWPVGGALEWSTFEIDGAGGRLTYGGGSSGLPSQARVGDIVTTPGESVVLAEEGPRPLDAFSLAVLRNSTIDGRPVRELESDRIGVARLPPDRSAHWPESTLAQVRGEYCAELETDPGQVPVVALGVAPNSSASSVGVPLQQSAVSVTPAGGAYVLSGAWSDTDDGSPYLVDSNGLAYPLVGPDVAANLGFADVDPPVVPDAWVELFDRGVNLSVSDALCPPVRASGKPCE
jgi:type VII secretion protein EccB